ncbi:hypothetical protein A3Q56_00982, partial [Intoshia linei]
MKNFVVLSLCFILLTGCESRFVGDRKRPTKRNVVTLTGTVNPADLQRTENNGPVINDLSTFEVPQLNQNQDQIHNTFTDGINQPIPALDENSSQDNEINSVYNLLKNRQTNNQNNNGPQQNRQNNNGRQQNGQNNNGPRPN